jgi:hypothetical protein
MAHAIGGNFDQYLSRFWWIEINILDFQGRFSFIEYCGFHSDSFRCYYGQVVWGHVDCPWAVYIENSCYRSQGGITAGD